MARRLPLHDAPYPVHPDYHFEATRAMRRFTLVLLLVVLAYAAMIVFAPKVAAALGVPVDLFDERLSTFAAEQRLRERGLTSRAARAIVDAEAAAVILQGWLDARIAAGSRT